MIRPQQVDNGFLLNQFYCNQDKSGKKNITDRRNPLEYYNMALKECIQRKERIKQLRLEAASQFNTPELDEKYKFYIPSKYFIICAPFRSLFKINS